MGILSYFGFHCLYEVRKQTRPVAGKDYWTKGAIRRFLAYKVFNMLPLSVIAKIQKQPYDK